MDILSVIVSILFLSLFLNLLLKKVHISPIVGYIFTGIIITVFIDFEHIDKNILSHIAEFGIVFLMFTIGLEFSVNHLKQMKKEVFVFGSLQVILTSIFFTYLSYYLFNLDIKTSIVIGSALALSSTAIVLKVLNENGDIHRPYGRNSVGILIFQDIAVIPILLMITILADSSISLEKILLNTFISAVVVGIIIYILGTFILPKFLSFVVDSQVTELFIVSILFIVLGSSLLAYSFGFSYSLGAFLAGMMIAETKYKYQIEADLVPFRDLLLGVFFITVGMQIHIDSFIENFYIIISLAIAILSLKVVIIFLIVRMFTFTKRAIKTALTLAQVGEFSFAVFALASSSNLISDEINNIMIPVVTISLLFTSLVLRHVRNFVDFFQKEHTEILRDPMLTNNIKDHIVVCGYSQLGQKIVKLLRAKGIPYVAIEQNRQHVKHGADIGDIVFFGNASSSILLNAVAIKDAKAVIIAIDNDDKIRLICENINAIDKNISISLKISHQAQLLEFEDLKIDSFINENEIVAHKLIKQVISLDKNTMNK